MNTKPNIITNYSKLPLEIQEQIKVAYPNGFYANLINFTTPNGKIESALPFETEDKKYMIRMDKDTAKEIIKLDDDFDRHGNLKEDIYTSLSEKHTDLEYLDL